MSLRRPTSRKYGQNWIAYAEPFLERVQSIRPSHLAKKLGCHTQRAAQILRDLGWRKEYRKQSLGPLYHNPDMEKIPDATK